jgi:hypothetical protein
MVSKALEPTQKAVTCPSSGVNFSGICPITACWFNTTNTDFQENGCTQMVFSHKHRISVLDLAIAYDKDVKELSNEMERGIVLLTVVERLQAWHEEGIYHGKFCPKCGLNKTNSLPCLNVLKCQERQDLINQVITFHPFTYFQDVYSKDELWSIFQNKEKIKVILFSGVLPNNLMYQLGQFGG